MAPSKQARGNDHISKIAADAGFTHWHTLWNANPALHAQRHNPNLLFKGDQTHVGDELTIPDREANDVVAASGSRHRFVLRSDTLFLRLRVLKADFTAIAPAAYTLTVDGTTFTGQTDRFGQLVAEIPRTAQAGELVVRAVAADIDPAGAPSPGGAPLRGPVPLRWSLQIGALNPLMEQAPTDDCISGVQQRLNNLGFQSGPITGVLDDTTRAALREFQVMLGLPATGKPDQARTQPELRAVHDTPDSVRGPCAATHSTASSVQP